MADLLYGVRLSDGKTVSINDIPDNMFGLSCECVCVLCGKAITGVLAKWKGETLF